MHPQYPDFQYQHKTPTKPKPNLFADGLCFINSEEKPRNLSIIEEFIGDTIHSDLLFLSKSKEQYLSQSQEFYSDFSQKSPVEDSQQSSELQQRYQTVKKPFKPKLEQQQPLTVKTARKNLKGCKCDSSKCQKNYCVCFKNGNTCSSDCQCVDCQNHQITEEHLKNQKVALEMLQNSQSIGCKCKSSNCIKNYCVCHSYGKKCSELCRCENCHNMEEKVKDRLTEQKEGINQMFTARKRIKISEFQSQENKENLNLNITNRIGY